MSTTHILNYIYATKKDEAPSDFLFLNILSNITGSG
jgi:hypothetical protein